MPDIEQILRGVLDQWKRGIDTHHPHSVAALFADDAIFQGLRPFSVGPAGVLDYYDSQPAGMAVDYRILAARRLGDHAVLGYLAATFTFRERDPLELRVGVVVTNTGAGWRIAYYQAGPTPDQ
ncbi:nuclear transport factor 2 family protein [Mycobacterium sp. shizuoka-1]|uniref:nuclear transport factor 2 family protein n=1 Tax=Mycobacterium sp. shizuoka-1 TaxID=2039281 RepID=UPI000C061668|nr:nuclear transport factor 2 family protein [Mycobacterium sp. shizuoka-1]GAY19232.1 hypothetical protein MSZK_59580 [Mycobacterium sp. shizuoka-1]